MGIVGHTTDTTTHTMDIEDLDTDLGVLAMEEWEDTVEMAILVDTMATKRG